VRAERAQAARLCSCGVVFAWPRTPIDEVDVTIDGHPPHFYAYPAALKARWLAARRPGGRLLEVGCGEGFFLEAAAAQGFEVEGLDAHPGRVETARARSGAPVHLGLFESMPLEGGYDIVYHCDLLSHFADPAGALRRMVSLLNPGGAICFEVGMLAGFHPAWYRFLPDMGLEGHHTFYTLEATLGLLERTGLHCVDRRQYRVGPTWLIGSATQWVRGARTSQRAATPRSEAPLGRDVYSAYQWLLSQVRYRVGRVLPGFGPGTLILLAEPDRGPC
jgi:SAM-dependent methyltransferase